MKFGIIIKILGALLCMLSMMMAFCLPTSWYFGGGDFVAIILSLAICLGVGLTLLYFTYKNKDKITKREGYLIVTSGWIIIAIFSSLPYIMSGALPEVHNAFFESMSGLTTTGASVIDNIEAQQHGILLWRSMTQWIGGMGIIVLTVAIFPLLGIGGVELFVAEAPGPTSDKIHPRISEVAKRLWYIYVGLTVLLFSILCFMGMSIYDAVNHAMTTMSTGGFSTKNDSMIHFSPSIQYIVALFMLIGGTNYTILYYVKNAKFRKIWKSEEFRMYLTFVSIATLLISTLVYLSGESSIEYAFRASLFQIISIITTTGFVSADYTAWSSGITILFFLLLFVGASAGSTSGGIKIIRHLVFVKNSMLEFKRILHPRAMIRIKIDRTIVTPRILTHILVFLLIYIFVFIVGSVLMTIILSDFDQPLVSAIGVVASSLGNVGPAIGNMGPLDNYSQIPAIGKYVLCFIMLLGRLELFSVLILFSPYYWKSN